MDPLFKNYDYNYLFGYFFGNKYNIGELTSATSKERMIMNIFFAGASPITRKIFTFPIAVQITEIATKCQMLLCMMIGFPFQGQMEISFEFLGAGKS